MKQSSFDKIFKIHCKIDTIYWTTRRRTNDYK